MFQLILLKACKMMGSTWVSFLCASFNAELQLESRSTLTAASTGVGHWGEPVCTKLSAMELWPWSYLSADTSCWILRKSHWTKTGTSTRSFCPAKANFVPLPCLYGKSKCRNASLNSWSSYAKCPNTKMYNKQPKKSLHPTQGTSLHMLPCREEAERKISVVPQYTSGSCSNTEEMSLA